MDNVINRISVESWCFKAPGSGYDIIFCAKSHAMSQMRHMISKRVFVVLMFIGSTPRWLLFVRSRRLGFTHLYGNNFPLARVLTWSPNEHIASPDLWCSWIMCQPKKLWNEQSCTLNDQEVRFLLRNILCWCMMNNMRSGQVLSILCWIEHWGNWTHPQLFIFTSVASYILTVAGRLRLTFLWQPSTVLNGIDYGQISPKENHCVTDRDKTIS